MFVLRYFSKLNWITAIWIQFFPFLKCAPIFATLCLSRHLLHYTHFFFYQADLLACAANEQLSSLRNQVNIPDPSYNYGSLFLQRTRKYYIDLPCNCELLQHDILFLKDNKRRLISHHCDFTSRFCKLIFHICVTQLCVKLDLALECRLTCRYFVKDHQLQCKLLEEDNNHVV